MQLGWLDVRVTRGMTAQMAELARAEASGARVMGWKVGFGAPAAMDKLGLRAPVVGHLLASARIAPGASVDTRGWVKPVVEPEVAVILVRDLDGSEDRATVRAAIGALAPALELADLCFPPEDVERIVAGNIYQRHVMFGPSVELHTSEPDDVLLPSLVARVWHGQLPLPVPAALHALTGDPVDIVAHVAKTLAACGRRLRSGEYVITGSIVPPVFGTTGDTVRYALDPAGEIVVTLG